MGWPWECGLGLGLEWSGLVNITAANTGFKFPDFFQFFLTCRTLYLLCLFLPTGRGNWKKSGNLSGQGKSEKGQEK